MSLDTMQTEDTARELLRALDRADAILNERKFLEPQARQRIEAELVTLAQRRQRIHQLIVTARLPTVQPPTQAQVGAVTAAARELDAISAANTTATAVLGLIATTANVVSS